MEKTCFIISSIGKDGGDIRDIADEKFDLIFEPVLKQFNYKVTRADKIGTPGSISREIVSNVINSDLVIADVSDENPNVFYELAIRNAVKKPVIVFRAANQRMPFDIYDTRAITIDRTKPRVWENSKKILHKHIEESEKNPDFASDSILTNFSFKLEDIGPETKEDRLYLIMRDLQQQVRKLSIDSQNRYYVTREERRHRAIQESIEKQVTNNVSISLGSSVPGCEETGDCFKPSILEIKKGETVVWSNNDTAAHTVTSGDPSDSNSVGTMFDSSLFMSGNTFSHTFEEVGTVDYFCIVHPWMKGSIIVK